MAEVGDNAITGRCYCGATTIRADRKTVAVAYCHCADCKRASGAPVSAVAAFDESDVTFVPDEGRAVSVNPDVTRTFCSVCCSPLAARYAYLPDQVYIPVSLLDQAEDLPPELHAYWSEHFAWLHLDDDLERFEKSSRSRLAKSEPVANSAPVE